MFGSMACSRWGVCLLAHFCCVCWRTDCQASQRHDRSVHLHKAGNTVNTIISCRLWSPPAAAVLASLLLVAGCAAARPVTTTATAESRQVIAELGQVETGRTLAAQVVRANASEDQPDRTPQRLLDALGAVVTDRGLLLTLGDVLFISGSGDLKPGTQGNLGDLVAFLTEYPVRNVLIEGHTDSIWSENFNQVLSQRRADSVKAYLVAQGIGAARLVAVGRGEFVPIADNGFAAGRQANRRVEVLIDHALDR